MSLLERLNYKILSVVLVIIVIIAVACNQYIVNNIEKDLARLDRALVGYYELVEKDDVNVIFNDEMKKSFESLHGSISSYVRQKSLFTSALIASQEKNNVLTEKLYRKLSNKHGSSYLGRLALLNLAYLQEDASKDIEALALFTKLSKQNGDSIIWSEATFNVARLTEKTDIEKSVKLYKELVDKLTEDNVWLKLAQNRLISLAKL